jgi:hypothetical protein
MVAVVGAVLMLVLLRVESVAEGRGALVLVLREPQILGVAVAVGRTAQIWAAMVALVLLLSDIG